MPATGDRIAERKDGLFQGMYTAQTPDGPKRKYIYGRKKKDVERRVQPHQQLAWKLAKPSLGLHECLDGSSVSPLWTCFGTATRPRSDIYSIDWSAVLVIVDHRVAGKETPHRFLLDPSFTQGGIVASPSAAMNGSEAEVRRRRDVTLTRSQDCVGQLEECIGALIED